MHEITVRPCEAETGWLVEHRSAQPMRFRSGAAAEACARGLVASLADDGHAARASIMLRDGSLAGSIIRF